MEKKAQLPFAADDDLSEDKLRTLLDFAQERKAELDELDYKVSFDMSSTQDKVELAKDVIAMNNTGSGYIPLGVADDGTLIGLSKEQYDALDLTPLSNKVNEYATPQDARLRIAKHQISLKGEEPKYFGLLYCPRRRGLPLVMAKDGNYPDPDRPGNVVHAFRKHDVYVRRGAQSQPMQPEDMQRFFEEALSAERQTWLEETKQLIGAASQTQEAAARVLSEETLRLDSMTFRSAVIEYVRRSDSVALAELSAIATYSASQAWGAARGRELEEAKKLLLTRFDLALDKLTLMAVAGIDHSQRHLLENALNGLANIYVLGEGTNILRTTPEPTAELLYKRPSEAIMTRCYGIGTYALAREQFSAIWNMAEIHVRLTDGTRHPLLRDNLANRRGEEWFAFLTAATQYLADNPEAFRLLPQELNRLQAAALEFDLLMGYLLWSIRAPRAPLFAMYYTYRTTPIIERIIQEKDNLLGASYDDQKFADFLRWVRHPLGHPLEPWELYDMPQPIRDFLKDHPPSKQ